MLKILPKPAKNFAAETQKDLSKGCLKKRLYKKIV